MNLRMWNFLSNRGRAFFSRVHGPNRNSRPDAVTAPEDPPTDILQLLLRLHDGEIHELPDLEFDGQRLIGSQAAMAKLLKIPVTSVNRQIRALAKHSLIEADTGGGITFLSLVSDSKAT